MPFVSASQRNFMFAKHPEIAKRFEAETPPDAKLPTHVPKKPKASLAQMFGKGK